MKTKNPPLDKVIKFLENPRLHNAWLKCGPIEVYVRKGRHLINNQITNTFDVASIKVQEKQRGKGLFKTFLIDLRSVLTTSYEYKYIYVESVLENRLLDFLPSVGFTMCPGSIPPSFYKLIKEND